ncbi:MAG: aspartate kinase [Chitinophagales bacterium]|nr:aspartate kinase [Bacteroidota bacterium]
MKVFKFGGASIKDAQGFHNVASILELYKEEKILMIVSALGKTTNAFEAVIKAYYESADNLAQHVQEIKDTHFAIMHDLFENEKHAAYKAVGKIFEELSQFLAQPPVDNFNYLYDQIVSKGEMLSTTILAYFLNEKGLKCQWLDVRNYIKTNHEYREGQVQWDATQKHIAKLKKTIEKQAPQLYLTQGFLGATPENFTTTLGREGSDYSGAIFAHCLDAESLTIWKDVPGMLSADPRLFPNAQLLAELTYEEVIEMAFYGATVIHHKTIKPLQNKNIPLHIKSFLNPQAQGTSIVPENKELNLPPMMSIRPQQVMLDIRTKDFSFIAGKRMYRLIDIFANHNITLNISQNSAITYKAVTNDNHHIAPLVDELSLYFDVKVFRPVEILSIRHYTDEIMNQYVADRQILIDQTDRGTINIVLKGESGIKNKGTV